MATFEDKVADYVGAITDNTALSDWLTAGAKLIVDLLPRHILEEYATTQSVTTSGLALATYRILDAIKGGYDAKRVPVGMRTAVQDGNSIHYAIEASPVSVIYNGKIYIYPNGGEVLAMTYPSVEFDDSAIANFPDRMEHGAVLYAAIQYCMFKYHSSLTVVDAITFPTAPTTPTAPDAPTITFTDVSGQTITLPTIPTYTKPTTTFSTTNMNTYIATDEDLDKAREESGQQKLLLEQYQMDLYNELNEYNKDLEIYKVQFQKAVADTQRAFEADQITRVKDFEALVADFQADLGIYQAEINAFASEYQNDVNAYISQVNTDLEIISKHLILADKLKVEFNEFIQGSIRSNG